MTRIVTLEAVVANQIAAGEVIERPASVAKELLENALDAGARSLVVDAERGGVGLLRVRDDGVGIHRDDLVLAFGRHATSKLRELADLDALATLGFRGEALPSIASVARVEITSRYRDTAGAFTASAEGSAEVRGPAPARHAEGTTVTVRDLFFNTPARRKFLRTERTEQRHLDDVVRALALARPDVAVEYRHNRRAVLRVPAAADAPGRAARVARLCGKAFVDSALELSVESAGLALTGWIAGPGGDRAQTDLQHFFLNRRMVRDGLLRHAVRAGFDGLLPAGRHPAYVLHLEVDPATVDVNVHPTKHEVRFREARLVHDFIASTIADALGRAGSLGFAAPAGVHPAPRAGASPGAMPGGARRPRPTRIAERFDAYGALHGPREEAPASAPAPPRPGAAAHAMDRYVARPRGDALEIVDLHAACRAILLHRWSLDADTPPAASRPVLVPETARVGPDVAERVECEAPALAAIGLHLGRLGERTVALREVPVAIAGVPTPAILAAIVEALDAGIATSSAPFIEAVLADAALMAEAAGADRDGWLDGFDRLCTERPESADGARVRLDAAALGRLLGGRT